MHDVQDFVENNNDSKSVKIEELPNILVLHLMRFSFENSGFVKIDKRVKFPPYLEIENDILANPSRHKVSKDIFFISIQIKLNRTHS